jgi:CRP-like cAMP-binding protein
MWQIPGVAAKETPVIQLCRVLLEDTDLGESLSPGVREAAARELVARVMIVPPGPWQVDELDREAIGLLVLEGLLIRRVGIDGRYGAELLGQGDLLRPWQGEDESPTAPTATGWRVLRPTQLAVLSDAFARRLTRYPEVLGHIVGRALRRSRNLAMNMAIVHQARVDVRLRVLFWHLAGRWGRVRSDGVFLPLRLTHNDLADLVAARRPTVTTALADLARAGTVVSTGNGWLLTGEPPGELLAFGAMPSTLTAAQPDGPS